MDNSPISSPLKAGQDYYLDEQGLMVLTAHFLLKRGHCCFSGCRHCPYENGQNIDPNVPLELQLSADEAWEEE